METNKKENQIKELTENRQAKFDYELSKKYDSGIVLEGLEVKEIVKNKINLSSSWVKIYNGEAFLINAEIANVAEPKREKKLLLTKKELKHLTGIVQQTGISLIPTKLYMVNHCIKLEFFEAKGKKLYDKRESIKNREIERTTASLIKRKNKM